MFRPSRGCLLLVLLLSSCSRRDADDAPLVEEQQHPYHPGVLNVLNVADPDAAPQLIKGWHQAEPDGWRWTEKNFAVLVGAPAPQQPATLELKFVIPEASIARLHSMTLRARLGSVSLPAATYSRAGSYTYTQAAPAAAMQGDTVLIEFQLDKALAPGEVDSRELGLAVSSVSLR